MSLSLTCLATLIGHEEDQIWCVAWTHDGQYLASCGLDKIVRIWGNHYHPGKWEDVTNVGCIATLEDAQARTLRSCDWSPDGTLLATASFDGTVIIWEAQNQNKTSWEQIASLEGHDSEVKCVSWNYDGQLVATCGRDKKIWIWEKLHGGEYECISVLDGHTQDVKFVKFHPTMPGVLISCSYDDTIRIWHEDSGDWYCKKVLQGHTSTVWGVGINPDLSRMVSCSDDRSLALWRCDQSSLSGEWQEQLPDAHKFTIYSVDWSRDHGRIVSAGGDNDIHIYDGNLNIECCVKGAHSNDINCVRWNPSTHQHNLLASCGDDGVVKIWTIE